MSMKNEKVFVIKARLNNGHVRAVNAIAPLEATLADVCRMKSIPMMSIISVQVSEPISAAEAVHYFTKEMLVIYTDPSSEVVSGRLSVEVA